MLPLNSIPYVRAALLRHVLCKRFGYREDSEAADYAFVAQIERHFESHGLSGEVEAMLRAVEAFVDETTPHFIRMVARRVPDAKITDRIRSGLGGSLGRVDHSKDAAECFYLLVQERYIKETY